MLNESDRLLVAHRLNFSLQDRILLQDIHLSLPQGKITMLIGPNGAGKSTLLRLLSGYLSATSGECYFQQKKIEAYSTIELAKYRAVMKQQSQLNFPFSVEEVIRMGGYHRRPQEVERDLLIVIQLTDCEPLRQKNYRQLSGGEQQRVQLARVLLQLWGENMQGKLLFLDEPTSALDLHHQQHCLRLMRKLCEERGLTVCCVLHDLNLASLYGDYFVLLAKQQIQAKGVAQQILTDTLIRQWYQADIEIHPHCLTAQPQVVFRK